jgi:hypothetical protein
MHCSGEAQDAVRDEPLETAFCAKWNEVLTSESASEAATLLTSATQANSQRATSTDLCRSWRLPASIRGDIYSHWRARPGQCRWLVQSARLGRIARAGEGLRVRPHVLIRLHIPTDSARDCERHVHVREGSYHVPVTSGTSCHRFWC